MIDFRRVMSAEVRKGGVVAGDITRDADETEFRYRPEYLAGKGGDVATTLPRRSQPYRERGGAVAAFFAGLLPEGRRLTAIQTQLKTSADDEFTQLVAVGRDMIGDIQVVPENLDLDDELSVVELPDVPDDELDLQRLFETMIGRRPLAGPSIPGAQDKLSGDVSDMISVPVTGRRFGPSIVKLSPPGYPLIVENEAFFLEVAKRCGLSVPRHQVIRDEAGVTALVVERFDRIVKGGATTRVAQEDSLQLLGRWPSAKYLVSTREVFRAVARRSAAPPVESLGLIRLFALGYVIGNGDLHGKNVSVYQLNGLWRLTPVYDMLSTLPYGDSRMALDLEGRDDNIRFRDLAALAARERVNEAAVRRAVDQVCTACDAAIDGAVTIGFDERTTNHLIRTVRKRIADLAS